MVGSHLDSDCGDERTLDSLCRAGAVVFVLGSLAYLVLIPGGLPTGKLLGSTSPRSRLTSSSTPTWWCGCWTRFRTLAHRRRAPSTGWPLLTCVSAWLILDTTEASSWAEALRLDRGGDSIGPALDDPLGDAGPGRPPTGAARQ